MIDISEDIHHLEINNNNARRKKVKKALIDFRTEGPLGKLELEIKKIGQEINTTYYKKNK